jgi:hypothetical protein
MIFRAGSSVRTLGIPPLMPLYSGLRLFLPEFGLNVRYKQGGGTKFYPKLREG